MKILDRYIFRALWPPFLGGFLGTLVIVTFGNTLRAVKLLAEGKVARTDIFWWYTYRIPEDVQYVFPVATMLATLLVFGQLARQSELTALRAAGINPARLSLPVAVFAFLSCLVLFHLLDEVVPRGMANSQRIWRERISTSAPLYHFKERILMKDRSNQLIYVGRFDLGDASMTHLLVREYDPRTREFLRQVAAPRAIHAARVPDSRGAGRHMSCRPCNHWILENAAVHVEAEPQPILIHKQTMEMELGEGPDDFAREDRSPVEMTGTELLGEIRRLEERGLADTLDLKVELYLKSSFPVCVIIFCVIGSVMGFTSGRAGGFIGFGVSLLITFLYYIAMSLSASLGKTAVVHPLLAAWLHNFLFVAVAAVLMVRAQNQ